MQPTLSDPGLTLHQAAQKRLEITAFSALFRWGGEEILQMQVVCSAELGLQISPAGWPVLKLRRGHGKGLKGTWVGTAGKKVLQWAGRPGLLRGCGEDAHTLLEGRQLIG